MTHIVAKRKAPQSAQRVVRPGESSSRRDRSTLIVAALVGFITFAVFWPATNNEFVNWDDDATITSNPHFRTLTSESLGWMFTTHHTGHWQPLSWITLAINARWAESAYGNATDPRPYHLTNIVIHALNAVLVFLLALRLLRLASPQQKDDSRLTLPMCAAFAALLFSLHPLRVESVAWATERRDVLSAAFFLGTILCYLRAVAPTDSAAPHAAIFYVLAILLAVLGLLAKSIGVVLPAVMLILDVYPLRRLSIDPRTWLRGASQRIFAEKIPFVLLAIIGSMIAMSAQRSAGAMLAMDQLGPGHRAYVMARGTAMYVWHSLLPLNLTPLYEIPYNFTLRDPEFVVSVVAIGAITIVAIVLARRWPSILAAWAVFCVIVLPVSGLFQSGPQMGADRYTYLSTLGFALLAGGAARHWCIRRQANSRRNLIAYGFATLLLIGLATLTILQIGVWRDSLSLWNAVIDRRPNTSLAYMNRGVVWTHRGDLNRAQTDLEKSLLLWPGEPVAMNNLASVLASRGEYARSEAILREVISLTPNAVDAHINLGYALLNLNRVDEGVGQYIVAFRLDPSRVDLMLNLARDLQSRGLHSQAFRAVNTTRELHPDNVEARLLAEQIARENERLPSSQ